VDAGFGAALKGTRTRYALPLEEVASHLQIDQGFLKALEDGTIAEECSELTARAYVRVYARFLGHDAEAILRGEPVGEPYPDSVAAQLAPEVPPAQPEDTAAAGVADSQGERPTGQLVMRVRIDRGRASPGARRKG
jgi:cytoskeletal protein RodZ